MDNEEELIKQAMAAIGRRRSAAKTEAARRNAQKAGEVHKRKAEERRAAREAEQAESESRGS